MGLIRRRLTSLFFLLFFVHAVVLNGVVATVNFPISNHNSAPSIITFDVCGHNAPSNTIQYFDLTAYITVQTPMFFTLGTIFFPAPDEAVASVNSGEIEEPPEA